MSQETVSGASAAPFPPTEEDSAAATPGRPPVLKVASKPDRIFEAPTSGGNDFMFGRDVASVFDDMVGRSVPFYAEIQRMTCEMAADFSRPGTAVSDYGCGTGTTLAALDPMLPEGVLFVGGR